VTDAAKLVAVLRDAIDAVRGGAVAVVDARVATGYAGSMSAGMMRTGKEEGKS
jgi:deoxycytidylate deaminase